MMKHANALNVKLVIMLFLIQSHLLKYAFHVILTTAASAHLMMKMWFALNAAMAITYIRIQTLKVYHAHRAMKTARLARKQHA